MFIHCAKSANIMIDPTGLPISVFDVPVNVDLILFMQAPLLTKIF